MTSSREMQQRPTGESGADAFVPSYHREMLLDRRRVRAFQKAIEHYGAPDRTFLEIGPGTGVMCLHAARHYERVIAVERDPEIFAVAQRNLRSAGALGAKVTLMQGDGLEADLPQADVIMAELLSTLMIHEPQVPVINRARASLRPGGAIIPGRIVNTVKLAWSKFSSQGVTFRSPYTLFTGVPQPEVLSESRVFFVADFRRGPVPERCAATVEMECLSDGLINALVFESLCDLAPGITFSGSDSLNPPMVIPIEPVQVSEGERVRARIEYGHFSDWDSLHATVDRIR